MQIADHRVRTGVGKERRTQGEEPGQITSDVVSAVVASVRKHEPRDREKHANEDVPQFGSIIVADRIFDARARAEHEAPEQQQQWQRDPQASDGPP